MNKERTDLNHFLYNIPFWIDRKDIYLWGLWKQMYRANKIIRELFVEEILPITDIEFIHAKFSHEYSKIVKGDYELEIVVYYETTLDFILQKTIDEELYEIAENISNFKKIQFIL